MKTNTYLAALCLLLALPVCYGCGSAGVGLDSTQVQQLGSALPPVESELQAELLRQLAAKGIDPGKAISAAPGADTAVFDLAAYVQEASGEDPAGVQLSWTYRNPGDYDLNTEVGVADVSQLITFWLASVAYDDPGPHGGLSGWPSGQPGDTGGVGAGEAPKPGSGAENWRKAQVDGDSNGEISAADIAPIASAYNVAIQRYNIYARETGGTGDFELVGEASVVQPENPYLPSRLSYFYAPAGTLAGLELEFVVRPENTALSAEGPDSNIAIATDPPDAELPSASLSADQTQGATPLAVLFAADVLAAPLTTIVRHEWDFDGDGYFDYDSGTENAANHTYTSPGKYIARLRATDSAGATALAGLEITAGQPPNAHIEASPDGGEVPLTVGFEARQSYSSISDIVRYEWDLDGDGVYELNRGVLSDLQADFTTAGAVAVGLRVTDEIGLTGETSVDLVFTDNYEEQEPNSLDSTATAFGLVSIGDPASEWRGNIGGGGYDGDNTDWLAFAVSEGAQGNFTITLPAPGAKLAVRLVDTDTFSVLHEVSPVTASTGFSRGIRGAGTYFIQVDNLNPATGANYDYSIGLQLGELEYDEVESNDSAGEANDLGVLNTSLVPGVWGSLGPGGYDGGDDDWFKFTLPQARNVTVLLDFFHLEADLDLTLYDAAGTVIYGVSESVTNKERIDAELPAGTYAVRCFRRDGGQANYELQVYFNP